MPACAVVAVHDREQDEGNTEAKDEPGRIRSTLCISSQVGCQMGCTFCATGGPCLCQIVSSHTGLWQCLCSDDFSATSKHPRHHRTELRHLWLTFRAFPLRCRQSSPLCFGGSSLLNSVPRSTQDRTQSQFLTLIGLRHTYGACYTVLIQMAAQLLRESSDVHTLIANPCRNYGAGRRSDCGGDC